MTKPNNICSCSSCNAPIILQKSAIKKQRFEDGIEFTYFKCNHCGARYVVLVTDKELRRKIHPNHGSSMAMKIRANNLKIKYIDRIKLLK